MPVTKSDFGKVKNGQTVTAYTLTNASGASVTLLDLGCTIQSVIDVPSCRQTLHDNVCHL